MLIYLVTYVLTPSPILRKKSMEDLFAVLEKFVQASQMLHNVDSPESSVKITI